MVNEEESLLVIYQSKWQRNLLARYGNELVYLDATYRTTKYALPLFFLCVQTNGGFCVVGAFITEREDSSSVAEALQVIKDNNSAWTCKGFMIDSSEVEANAIHSVFPESKIYICDFHRKQAWHRWLIASKHGVTSQEQTSNLLNAVAESFTEDEFQQNLTRLHESQVWKTQPKLQNYINGQWLANDKHKMWVWAYRGDELTLVVNSNNGVEAQNEVFKYEYLSSLPMKTVSSLMTLLVEDFFVDSYRKYLESNVTMSAGWREPSGSVPKELHNRPKYLVQHIREATVRCSDITSDMVTMVTEKEFLVQSSNRQSHFYRINLGDESSHTMPSCDCRAFKKTHFPCKHFCVLICHINNITWNSLTNFYMNNPHFIIDEDCVKLPKDQLFNIQEVEHSTTACAPCKDLDNTITEPQQPQGPSLSDSARKVREILKDLYNLTYIADSVQAMEEARKHLSSASEQLRDGCPANGSLLLENIPPKRPSKKRKLSTEPLLKKLPTRAKRKRTIKRKESLKVYFQDNIHIYDMFCIT
ncbi:uncharacterized protein [Argopecten irradians]|uniref:uncharacterized protein n=1 Tax=Argopecten irradians TaxID=31199 RepID=UPI003719E9A6